MRTHTLLPLVCLLLIGFAAFAGTPQKVQSARVGKGLWEATIYRTTAIASAAIDTAFVDTKDLWVGQLGAASTAGIGVFIVFDKLAVGDSLLFLAASCADTSRLTCLANIASFQVVGGAAATSAFVKATAGPECRYWRTIITNNQHASQAAIDYRCRIQAAAASGP